MTGLTPWLHPWRLSMAICMVVAVAPASQARLQPGCRTSQPTQTAVVRTADLVGPATTVAKAHSAAVSADLSSTLRHLPARPISTTISTYGKPVTTDATARGVYARLTAGQIVRIPIQWNNGHPISSAGGGPRDISADAWIATILAMHAKPMIVIGGTSDNNFSASDAAAIVKRYKGKLYGVVLGNEADNGGMEINDYIDHVYQPAAQAIRDADPTVKIAGPAQASFKTGDLQTFIRDCRGMYDIIDYHHYGAGTTSPDDATLMNIAGQYESEINQIRGWLNAAGQPGVQIQVGEFNLAWRYEDGAPGGEGRFFTSFNTAWSATALGHILRGGGRGLAYAQQNGPLGIMVQPGDHDNGHPDGTPQPIYHGLGMFQGEGLFRPFGSAVMKSTSDASVDCFASNNGNIVLVNKTKTDKRVTLSIKGGSDGRITFWASDTGNPYGRPTSSSTVVTGGRTSLTLKPYQVVTVLAGVVRG